MKYHDEPTHAIFNAGRWIAACPECGRKGMQIFDEVKPGGDFICPFENPGMVATIAVAVDLTEKEKVSLRRLGVRSEFKVRGAPDMEAREKARKDAIRYKVIFPTERKEIEAILRRRPIVGMGWKPGETLDDLRAENVQRGLEA